MSAAVDTRLVRLGSLLAAVAVGAGASGAHGALHDHLVATGHLDHWRTAVEYHLVHAVALVALAFVVRRGGNRARWAWRLLCVGVVLFSGSLYVLAATDTRWLGAITPLGGVSFIGGWILLALAPWNECQE